MEQKKYVAYGWICIGTALLAVGVQNFLEPAGLVAGGISGLGMILDDLSQRLGGPAVPLWLVNTICNVPLFLWAFVAKGWQFVGKTLFATVLFSVMLYFAALFPRYTGDLLTASAYGGLLSGAGLAMVLHGGATTGGVDLAASLLHGTLLQHIAVPILIFLLDATIIVLGLLTFGATNTLYALLSVGIMEKVLHLAAEGVNQKCAAWIYSKNSAGLSDKLRDAEISVLQNKQNKQCLIGEGQFVFCVFSQKEVSKVKQIIANIDNNACFLLLDVREVMGEMSISE